MKRIPLVVVVVALLAVPALAAVRAWPVQISPGSPNVDTQNLSVQFKAPYALPRGWKWDAILVVLSGGDTSCASTEEVKSSQPAGRGQTVRLTFQPDKSLESELSGPLFKWCQAAADLTITASHGKRDSLITRKSFRFAP
jgi:hypothetical protein